MITIYIMAQNCQENNRVKVRKSFDTLNRQQFAARREL
jgi:hypothetical protein